MHSRYGPDDDAVLQWAKDAAAELVALERGNDLAALAEQEARAATAGQGDIGFERLQAGAGLSAWLTTPLLNCSNWRCPTPFCVAVDGAELGADGADEVAFLLAAHPGATPAPIGKAASGGELSRIMLALEVVLADTDAVGTFVFDEVDFRSRRCRRDRRDRPATGRWHSTPRSSW